MPFFAESVKDALTEARCTYLSSQALTAKGTWTRDHAAIFCSHNTWTVTRDDWFHQKTTIVSERLAKLMEERPEHWPLFFTIELEKKNSLVAGRLCCPID